MTQAMLLYPPITDFTSPYHSLVYLATFARNAGFKEIEVRDTNIEALNYCALPAVLAEMQSEWRARRHSLSSRRSLDGLEQGEYRRLVRAEAVDAAGVGGAVDVLRDPGRFYDYAAYRGAVDRIDLWIESLSCSGIPGQFDAGGIALRRFGSFSLSSVDDLTNEPLLERVVGAFVRFYKDKFFPELIRKDPRVVGINVTYTSQLPYALWLVRQMRKILPAAYIVCGGTEVSGVWKYLADQRRMVDLFDGADACVIGEGETAFVRILDAVLSGRSPGPLANVVRLDRVRRTIEPPAGIRYEKLDALPTPDYSLLDPSPYFSPHSLVCYSPTRGCYWNKCTFCDYGLNFGTPTSPWRQLSVERCVDDLRTIRSYAQHVYFSVDVLAPARLAQLGDALVDAGIDLRWSAEIRLERYFNRERCERLRRSGCVAVSVGFEAGSQRILDLIDKGVKLADVEGTIRSFAEAGIAVQMMGFTGFPSESNAEAMASVAFLKETARWWTVSALGTFMLTPGAILAGKPTESGMENVHDFDGDDIRRTLFVEDVHAGPSATRDFEALQRAKLDLITAEFDRPFAGGVDAAHSIFYYDRFGQRFPRDVIPAARAVLPHYDLDAVPARNGVLLASEHYDPLRALSESAIEAEHRHAAARGVSLDRRALLAALASREPLQRSDAVKRFIVRWDGALIPCPAYAALLFDTVDGVRSLAEIQALVKPSLEAVPPEELFGYADALSLVAERAQGRFGTERGSANTAADAFRSLVTALVAVNVLVADTSAPRDTVPSARLHILNETR